MGELKQISQKEAMVDLEYREALEMAKTLTGLYFESLSKIDGRMRIYLNGVLVWESVGSLL